MRDPYDVLGMSRNTSEEVLKAKYDELRAKYGEQRFREGEIGNEGARLYSELDEAWKAIVQDLDRRRYRPADGDVFAAIDNLIKTGNNAEAQTALDSIVARDAQWHYFQAMVYYKKEWLTESRAQLSIAVNMEPNNTKYQDALRKLNMVIGDPNVRADSIGRQNQGPYGENQNPNSDFYGSRSDGTGNDLATCCATYCLLESCCTLMRCC